MKPVNNKELREVIKDYLQTEQSKPLLIVSKPLSGRSSTIEGVMTELNLDNEDIQVLHLDMVDKEFCVNKTAKHTFEEYVLALVPSDAKMLVEVDINAPYYTGGLWDRKSKFEETWSYYMESDKYKIVPYIPEVQEWIHWATTKGGIHNEVIRFAEKYPSFYTFMPYDIYNRIDEDVCFREGLSRDGRNKPEAEIRFGYWGDEDSFIGICLDKLFKDMLNEECEGGEVRQLYIGK